MKTITIALIGSGYGAYLHGNGYKKINGINIRLKMVVDIDLKKAKEFAKKYGFEQVSTNFSDVLRDEEIDVIDIATPPYLHLKFALEALKAGKHVICEKPLTGYFGAKDDERPIGNEVSKDKMYKRVLKEIEEARKIIKASNKIFMYAENYVYSPSILKAAEIIKSRNCKIVFMKGEESQRGSTSPVAGNWEKTGGGSLIRIGCHPLSGMLWLKKIEAQARNEEISVVSVVADVGHIIKTLTKHERRYLTFKPIDVEDFATSTITFSDGTKALVISSDVVLGGTKNYIEIYGNDCSLICNITPTDNMKTYFLDNEGIKDVYISEQLTEKTGWNNVFILEDILRGYTYELQDFIECVFYGRKPLSGIDLAYETIKIIYASYLSASEGKKITF